MPIDLCKCYAYTSDVFRNVWTRMREGSPTLLLTALQTPFRSFLFLTVGTLLWFWRCIVSFCLQVITASAVSEGHAAWSGSCKTKKVSFRGQRCLLRILLSALSVYLYTVHIVPRC